MMWRDLPEKCIIIGRGLARRCHSAVGVLYLRSHRIIYEGGITKSISQEREKKEGRPRGQFKWAERSAKSSEEKMRVDR
jgi:hypothetical protein